MGLKAIETIYNGHKFRSRLEAKWAVFFNALGVPYKYEPEGFDLDGLWYLPDFWLPEQQAWVEIKGPPPTVEDMEKVFRLAEHQYTVDPDVRVFLFGDIASSYHNQKTIPVYGDLIVSPAKTTSVIDEDEGDPRIVSDYAWTVCPICKCIDLTFNGYGDFLQCGCLRGIRQDTFQLTDAPKWWVRKIVDFFSLDAIPPILEAYDTARMARFEHGRHGN